MTGGYRRRTLPTGSFLVSRPRDPDRIFDPSIPGPEEGRDFGRITGLAADPAEGEGAGVGHLYSSADNGGTWSDISANFPDIPVNSVQSLPSGGLLAGTDLGVLYRAQRDELACGHAWARDLANLGVRPLGRTNQAEGPPAGAALPL